MNQQISGIPWHTFWSVNDGYVHDVEPWKQTNQAPAIWFEENALQYIYDPKMIFENMVDLAEVDPPGERGIYFISDGIDIAYVGISNNIYNRLQQHLLNGMPIKRFWCFGGMPEMYIKSIEAAYIAHIKPAFNTDYPHAPPHLLRHFVTAVSDTT
jgi:hypothetical protein